MNSPPPKGTTLCLCRSSRANQVVDEQASEPLVAASIDFVRLPSRRLPRCVACVTRRWLTNLVFSAQPMQNEQRAHHSEDSPARARIWGHDHDDADESGPDKCQHVDETAQVPKMLGAAISNPARFLSPAQIHGYAIGQIEANHADRGNDRIRPAVDHCCARQSGRKPERRSRCFVPETNSAPYLRERHPPIASKRINRARERRQRSETAEPHGHDREPENSDHCPAAQSRLHDCQDCWKGSAVGTFRG